MKTRITKEMIVEAGFMIVRDEGEEKLSVRNIAGILGCSTQPIMYCYPTVSELRQDILEKANEFHTKYLVRETGNHILIDIGMNYVRFASEEKNLFKFIVMSDNSQGAGVADLIASDDAGGLLSILEREHELTSEQARDVLELLFTQFHGYAALMAYGSAKYDLIHCKRQLLRVYYGVIAFIKSGERLETVMLV